MNEFQETLKELLDEKGLNRKQLAEAINISTSALNGYFNKNLYPSIDIAIKISEFFDCSINYLLGLTNEREFKLKLTNRKFIENYNILLKEKNISRAKSLRELNMSEKNYSIWKKDRLPKTYNLIAIAKYFNTSIDFLIGRSGF